MRVLKFLLGIGVSCSCAFLAGCCWFMGNPQVKFTYTPLMPKVNEVVVFFATQEGGARVISWEWDFGDGGKGIGQVVTYKYSRAGPFNVTLVATDECGKKGTYNATVVVSDEAAGCDLTGTWHGSITCSYWPRSTYMFVLQLTRSGDTVSGTAFVGDLSSPGSGTYVAGRFQFSFIWPYYSYPQVTLVGTLNPVTCELSGEWYVAGQVYGTWRVSKR